MKKRRIVTVSRKDESIYINPSHMTHSIVIAEAEKTVVQENEISGIVDEIQALINPNFWTAVASECSKGKIHARNYMSLVSRPVGPELIEPILKELGIEDNTSIFLRNPVVSLDYGKTKQSIYALIVFKDTDPKIIISNFEPLFAEATDFPANGNPYSATGSDTQKTDEEKPGVGALGWIMSVCALAGGVGLSLLLGHIFDSGAAEAIGFFAGLFLGAIISVFFFAGIHSGKTPKQPHKEIENKEIEEPD